MTIPALLDGLLVWALYPLWLVAGFIDYVFHRRTRIDRTSGPPEAWLHVAQFAALGIAAAAVAGLHMNRLTFALLTVCVAAHSAMAYADVAFTDGRRYIAPLEQQVHGYMEVLPVAALAILAVLHWERLSIPDWSWRANPAPGPGAWAFVGSYLVLAGLPVAEELLRCLGGLRYHQVEHDHQRREGHDPKGDPRTQVASVRRR
jgi:hypothetical protein